MTSASRVVVSGLQKSYGNIEAVRGVSFDIRDGEIFGLLGPNGAGKTTTIECVLGLTAPDAGSIEICGIDARRHPTEVRQRVGAVLQTTALHDRITPREALTLFAAFYRTSLDAATLLARFSLTEKADVGVDTLSGGQKQRLALALAFVNNPALVFLDEPTAGLDAHSRRELHAVIRAMRHDGHTVLLTTHQLDEAEQLCDRIAIINQGRIVATGSPRELVAQSARVQQITFRTDAPLPAGLLETLPDIQAFDDHGGSLRTSTPGPTLMALLSGLDAHGIGLHELHVQKATLEDVFVDLTESQPAGPHA